jgi:AcrR family transcriptional regulator
MNPTRTLDADVSMDQENAERPPNGDVRPARRDRDAKQRSARDSFIGRVAAAGFRNTRIEDVCRDVGVSHREFYRWFGNKDQCYLSIFDMFGRSLIDVGERIFDGTAGPWEEKLRAGLLAVVGELARDPRQARFLLECHAVGGGEGAMWRLVASAERVYLTDEVRSQAPPAPAAASESIAAGVAVEPIRRYLEEGKVDELPDLVPWIVYYMTLYLFGPERAAGQRPPPGPEARDHGQ